MWNLRQEPLSRGASPLAVAAGKLAFSFNVFNVTNEDAATNIYPFSQLPDGTLNPLYNQPVAYQTPTYARLTVSYDY